MHPATANLMRWLSPNPNLPDPQRELAEACQGLAIEMTEKCPEGAELSTGLRKLLEAKDCFVRASMEEQT